MDVNKPDLKKNSECAGAWSSYSNYVPWPDMRKWLENRLNKEKGHE